MDAATEILDRLMQGLWIGGLAATPLAMVVALLCRIRSLRPATRHVLWGAVLLSLVTPALGMVVWRPDWFRSEHLASATDSALEKLEAALPHAQAPRVVPDAGSGDAGCASTEDIEAAPILAWNVPESAQPQEVREWREPDGAAALRDVAASPSELPGPQSEVGPRTGVIFPTDSLLRPGVAPVPEPMRSVLPPLASVVTDAPVSDQAAQPPENSADVQMRNLAAGWWTSVRAGVRRCVARALDLRDSVAELPPIPVSIWLGGTALLIAIRMVRTLAAARILRRARPADAEIRSLVTRTAAEIGLSSVPQTCVVVSAISPMVLCGLRPRLVLPLPLWRSLESEARRAVLVHELAHLKRKDHVTCWIEMAISALYWWHPVAWWAGARLRDHAEASCDAWVTKLLPSSRRAYAVALVATKSYLSLRGQGAGPWLGILSGSAGKLERRITMVMTQRTTPRVSAVGALVAAAVMVLGTFVVPSMACPPEESEAQVKVKAKKERAQKAEKASDEVFFGEAPALEAMRGGGGASAPKAPKAPRAAERLEIRSDPMASNDYTTGRTTRVYKLSEGKLEAFWELMSRSDVPILVQMQGDGIQVWATEEQHPKIEAFIRIISPDAVSGATSGPRVVEIRPEQFRLRAGQRADELRARQDALRVTAQNRAEIERQAVRAREEAEKARDQADQLRELTQSLRGQMNEVEEREARAALERAAAQIRARSDAIRSQSRNMDSRVRDLEKQLDQLEKRTEEIEKQLEELEEMDSDSEIGALPSLAPAAVAGTAVTVPSAPSANTRAGVSVGRAGTTVRALPTPSVSTGTAAVSVPAAIAPTAPSAAGPLAPARVPTPPAPPTPSVPSAAASPATAPAAPAAPSAPAAPASTPVTPPAGGTY